jgi:hypothetical protein
MASTTFGRALRNVAVRRLSPIFCFGACWTRTSFVVAVTRCQYDDEDGGCIDASCLYLHLTKSPDVGDLDYGSPLRPTFVRKRLRPPAVNTSASNPSPCLAAIDSNEDDISPPASPTGTAQPVPTSETVRLPELSALSLFERG